MLIAVQQLGGAFGIAVLGTVFFNALIASTATTQIGVFRHGASVAIWVAAAFMVVTFLLPKRACEGTPAH